MLSIMGCASANSSRAAIRCCSREVRECCSEVLHETAETTDSATKPPRLCRLSLDAANSVNERSRRREFVADCSDYHDEYGAAHRVSMTAMRLLTRAPKRRTS